MVSASELEYHVLLAKDLKLISCADSAGHAVETHDYRADAKAEG